MIVRGKPTRRQTIRAIMACWGWSRAAATHAVDVWGFYPWKKIEPDEQED